MCIGKMVIGFGVNINCDCMVDLLFVVEGGVQVVYFFIDLIRGIDGFGDFVVEVYVEVMVQMVYVGVDCIGV